MKRFCLCCIVCLILLFGQVGLAEDSNDEISQPSEMSLVDADLTLIGEDNGDWAGYFASPAGDVNGDGLGDALIGAAMAGNKVCPIPKDPCPPPYIPKGEGVAYLVLGRPQEDWLPTPVDLGNSDASFLGCGTNSMTARQLYTAGDVNGDGYDDILVSGWKCGPSFTGKAYLFLGRPDVGTWGRYFPVEGADASFLGEREWDFLSYYTSTAGDVNADGYDDFLITSTHYDIIDTQIITDTGKTYLILGRQAADWGSDYDVGQADASFLGEAESDRLGRSASGVGDVNGDGYDDFMIGSISSDAGGWDAGQSYLFLGRATESDPSYDPSRPWWGRDFSVSGADASFVGEAVGDESGRRVAQAGDVNNDGYSDILIGAARNSVVGHWSGIAYLILGKPSADWGMQFSLYDADASFLGEAADDQAGRRLSGAGDVNNDGFDDFLIGAPHNQRGGELAGADYLIFGRQTVDWGRYYSLSQADFIHLGKPDVGVAGYDMAWLGDFDGDNIDDYLIAAYGGRNNTEVPGEVYVLLGNVNIKNKAKTPMPIRFTPDKPKGIPTFWHWFTSEYWDPNGWSDIGQTQLILGESLDDPTGFYIRYDPGSDELYLRNSNGDNWLGPCEIGQNQKLDNGVVLLDCLGSYITINDDKSLSVTLRLRWLALPSCSLEYKAYLRVIDQMGHDSQFRVLGGWTPLSRRVYMPFLKK